jgi:adenylosuccinate synthase
MPATVITGCQWGDEGKGKVTDYLTTTADIVVRSQGGNNAGHTVVHRGERFKLHVIPSGILHPDKLNLIAGGVAIHPPSLVKEIDDLQARGVICSNLRISPSCHIVFPYHIELDKLEEKRRGAQRIGTTARGNGPVFADKMARSGFRLLDCLRDDFLERLRYVLEEKNCLFSLFHGVEGFAAEQIYDEYMPLLNRIKPHIADVKKILRDARKEGKQVLFEGAQGVLLDIDYGIYYPYVTSSHPGAIGACISTGWPPNALDRVIGVAKAYLTRVGEGPFPSELHGELGDAVRNRGGEFGTTTGRPRRVGWLDLVLLKYACEINGLDGLALTKVDVLDDLDEVKVVTAYSLEGFETQDVPLEQEVLNRAEPVYKTLPGWKTDTTSIAKAAEIPPKLKDYMGFIGDFCGVKISYISCGQSREQMVEL